MIYFEIFWSELGDLCPIKFKEYIEGKTYFV